MHRELHFYEPFSIEQKKEKLLAHQQFNVKMETVLFTFYVMFETEDGNWIKVGSLCNNDPNQFN